MKNQERRERIKELRKHLDPMRGEMLRLNLRLNYLKNKYRNVWSGEVAREIEQLEAEKSSLIDTLRPVEIKLSKLQIKYLVDFEYEVASEGLHGWKNEKREIHLSTDLNLDLEIGEIDHQDEDVKAFKQELIDFFYPTYTSVAIKSIKKI